MVCGYFGRNLQLVGEIMKTKKQQFIEWYKNYDRFTFDHCADKYFLKECDNPDDLNSHIDYFLEEAMENQKNTSEYRELLRIRQMK